MPQTVYLVKFPDGHTQQFSGPDSMSDVDVQNRAIQERAFSEDKIPSTYYQGAKQGLGDSLAENSGLIGTGVSAAGMLAANPAIVAAGPLVGRAAKAGAEALAGRPITPTSASEVGTLGAEGLAAAYGPALVARSGSALTRAIGSLPTSTLPQALAKGTAEALGPSLTRTAAAATPAAVGEAFAQDAKMLGDKVALVRAGVSADDYKLLMDSIASGMRPSAAIKVVSDGDPKLFGKLMTLYLRSRSVAP